MQPVKTTNDKAIQFWNKCVCALPQKTVGHNDINVNEVVVQEGGQDCCNDCDHDS